MTGQVRLIIRDYGAFLDRVRGNDELSYRLVLGLLGDEVHREAEIEAAPEDGGPAGPGGRGLGGQHNHRPPQDRYTPRAPDHVPA